MDCHICYDKNSCLKSLPCEHSLCYNCFIRLANSICPYCREIFIYTPEEIIQRANIGLRNGYQSNDLQPGLNIPDEFIFTSSSQLLPSIIYQRNNRLENHYQMIEIRNTKKINKYKKNRLSLEEINDRRNITNKRELKKWLRRERRLEKMNQSSILSSDEFLD
jgi:hypothetical protein